MEQGFRKCAATQNFNTGVSRCLIDPDKIKGAILIQHGYKLPENITAESLREACHADRPARLFPITGIVEYAPSGGEAQVSATGYGPNKITGYSARTDTFTLQDYDLSLKANLVAMKRVQMDVYLYDANNVIYGMSDGTNRLAGIELSGVYPSGQDWDSSGQDAYVALNILLKDVERYMKNANVYQCNFDITSALVGLTYVEFVSVSGNTYKLIEHYGKLDITAYYGAILAEKSSSVLNGASSVTYNSEADTMTMTGEVTFKSPSTLFTNGIEGIEQWKE